MPINEKIKPKKHNIGKNENTNATTDIGFDSFFLLTILIFLSPVGAPQCEQNDLLYSISFPQRLQYILHPPF